MISKTDLSGSWGFRADEAMQGVSGRFWEIPPEDRIPLPSTTSAQRKGSPNTRREEGFLTDSYAFEGWAWYYKTVDLGELPADCRAELFLERTRMTRLWVNGRLVGSFDSLCTPHIYDISDYIAQGKAELCLLVSNTGYPTKGGHMTSQDTQSNWNGVTGEISLRISGKQRIAGIQAYPDAEGRSVRLRFELEGLSEAQISVWGCSSDGKPVDTQDLTVSAELPEAVIELGEEASLWSEHSPVTYTLKAALAGSADIETVTFGLRDFRARGMDFLLNGRPVQPRGRHDGLVFPLTGAAPTTVEEWYEYLQKAKYWGLDHVRFHTCCPPEAAFTAADMLGIFMQPELPFWGTLAAPGEEGFDEEEQSFLISEGLRILKCFGSHPSFVMMSLGNELWGSPERMGQILEMFRSQDPRHLYTQGSNNFQFYPNIRPEDDFFSGVRLSRDRLIRGSYAACDKPFGFVQTEQPNTAHSYDKVIFPEEMSGSSDGGEEFIQIQFGTGVKRVRATHSGGGLVPTKPIVTHEIGQYCSFPDFDEIPRFTGPLKPRALEIARETLERKGMSELAQKLHTASGLHAFSCYKLELEAAMRARNIAGFQLLDLQDFPGQGIALVGMLNSLMEEKTFVSRFGLREKWLGSCSDAVILAELDSFVLTEGQTVTVPVLMRYSRPEPLFGKRICWSAGEESGELAVPEGFTGLGRIGQITFKAPKTGEFSLKLRAEGVRPQGDLLPTFTENSYRLWSFPAAEKDLRLCAEGVTVTSDLEEAKAALDAGGRVLFLPRELPCAVPGFYCADFWNYPMFSTISESMGRELPAGTMGLLIQEGHPALEGFFSDFFTTPQWYQIVTHSSLAVMDEAPAGFRPIVQMIDNFQRCHRLGLLWEARVGKGSLLVCTARLDEILELPEVQAFARGLLRYAASEKFAPDRELTLSQQGLEEFH
ncbi:MAG: beta-glucuronidase [Ruminococcus sp.]|nr:beta-glucuronidase [Ruminococcus sp.]